LLQVTDTFGHFPSEPADLFKELVSGFAITASLVADAHGGTVSELGNSRGIGNATDLALLIALRRQSEVILTSGKTFRCDQYKFPKNADLAVLTKQNLEVEAPAGQRLTVLRTGYTSSIRELKSIGYSRIHVEYGVSGITELLEHCELDAIFLSSKSRSGLAALSDALGVEPVVVELSDLYVGLVAWQPKRLDS
jgi:riboflavin biosynthesis pyrimidine reductase